MKKKLVYKVISIFIIFFSITLLSACSDNDNNDDDYNINDAPLTQTITEIDEAALLFMLEEEKLARDTYIYLNNLWSINQFANIQKSEQSHMNAVENLLIKYNITYSILPSGEFKNPDLQNLYNKFIVDGKINQANALQIGATIEDLDIVDLETHIDASNDAEIISVFESLQCGSRNHLRSFVSNIEKGGDTYTPQFLTKDAYNTIISSSNEKCN
ncbi:DUF2202 domain-containing protein [uncultured Algibacter sp.]|uniref:DUF2202 domain-containing protein n=1 Tax=uncultured Algibacter sp. TaxID=298659 RepID=UPI002618410A|nr:DUF2202 domain-containing protein [uncultured Algibacter sp.]